MVPETDVNTKEESGHLVFTVNKIDRTKSGNHCSHTELDEFPADSIQISSQALVIRTCSANRLPHAAAPGEKDVRRPTLIANLLPCLLGKIWSNLGIWGIHGQRIRQSSNMVQLGKHQVTDFFFNDQFVTNQLKRSLQSLASLPPHARILNQRFYHSDILPLMWRFNPRLTIHDFTRLGIWVLNGGINIVNKQQKQW